MRKASTITQLDYEPSGYEEGYEAGKAEGRRLEQRWLLNYARNNLNVVGLEREFAEFEKKVAKRSKPAKRKEGR